VYGLEDALCVVVAGLEVTEYPVIEEPPVALAENGTDTVVPVPPSVAEPIVGACGTVLGTTEEEELEATEVPLAFVAVMVYVLAVPKFDSVIEIGLEVPVAVAVEEEVTVYPVIDFPPVAPAVNGTETDAEPE